VVPVEQLAKVLCRGLGDAVDVLGDGPDLLGHPCGGGSGRGDEGIAEDAGRAGENERADISGYRLLQEIERAGDVGIDEGLSAMGGDMGLVQRRRVEDRLHAGSCDAGRKRDRL
jgi:hypothetical protein